MDLRVGPYIVEPALNRVVRDGRDYHVTPKAMDVLVSLLRHEGQVVSKDDLIKEVWGDTFVSDDSLVRCVAELRKVFGDDARNSTVIETIPKRGYRLVSARLDEKDELRDQIRLVQTAVAEQPASVPTSHSRLLTRRRTVAGSAVLFGSALLAVGIRPLWKRWQASSTRLNIRSIVVLPLVNVSPETRDDYFSEGMTESLIVELSRIHELRVIARTSAMRYKDRTKPLPQIARELGVSGVVEGTVARSAGRVRITAELIDPATEVNLWSDAFERDLGDVLSIQSDIARSIAAKVSVSLDTEERGQLAERRRVVPEAYEAFLKGRYFLERKDFRKSADYFETATMKDPRFALAYTFLFEAEAMMSFSRDEALSDGAANALRKAGELDDALAEFHCGKGDLLFWGNWQWKEGEAEFRRAVEIDPRSTLASEHYGGCLLVQRRWGEAIAEFRRAIQTDPVSPGLNQLLLEALIASGQESAATEQLRKFMELNPSNPIAWELAATLHASFGRGHDAIGCWVKALQFRAATSAADLRALEEAGKRGGIRAYWIKRLEQTGFRGLALELAGRFVWAGRHEDALRLLEGSVQRRSARLPLINSNIVFEPLRAHPRFQSILQRMGLMPSAK